ncbi:MAG: hypothetical protein IJF27_06480 [Oscillospiraceae bacterium]|nr:hypothetical protein [Oscillospiraceae bacterium]MBQ3048954.1 hypothetical protein [Oscillospiraceae bacterium]
MSQTIIAKFSDIDSAERAATALKHSALAPHIEKMYLTARRPDIHSHRATLLPFTSNETSPFHNGTYNSYQNTADNPFGYTGGVFIFPNEAINSTLHRTKESYLRLICTNESANALHGKLISLGAYEITQS